ncbi:MAG: CerR family C-terminal domain-containing protein [Planctomycetota bacterium]
MTVNSISTASGNGYSSRQRLIDSASELFAEKGFAGTSVRQIIHKAGCNIAAVNYHFGGKEQLYKEVFRSQLERMKKMRVDSINHVMDEDFGLPSLEMLLRSFVASFMESLLVDQKGHHFVSLVMREMLDPHLSEEIFVAEYIEPVTRVFIEALRKLRPSLDLDTAMMCVYSVVGQIFQVCRASSMAKKLSQGDNFVFDRQRAIDHIVKFSAAGIEEAAGGVKDE